MESYQIRLKSYRMVKFLRVNPHLSPTMEGKDRVRRRENYKDEGSYDDFKIFFMSNKADLISENSNHEPHYKLINEIICRDVGCNVPTYYLSWCAFPLLVRVPMSRSPRHPSTAWVYCRRGVTPLFPKNKNHS